MIRLLIMLLIASALADPFIESMKAKHRCTHNRLHPGRTLYVSEDADRILQESVEPQPMRIRFIKQDWPSYQYEEHRLKYLQNLMDITATYFSRHIKVVPGGGKLKFEFTETVYLFQDYDSNFARREEEGRVHLDPKTKKEVLEKKEEIKCLNTLVPEEHLSEGVDDADLVVYLTAFDENIEYFSYSGSCLVTPRPTFAHLHVNTFFMRDRYFEPSDPGQFEYLLEIFVHEMFHILGFSRDLYPYFQKPNGDYYSAQEMFTIVDHQVYLTLPTVTKVAREYYACDSLEGMLLENDEKYVDLEDLHDGDDKVETEIHERDAYSASHWERAVLADEIMTASHIGDLEISRFTLALLIDTNWYHGISLDKYDQIHFGRGRGCAFVRKLCHGNSKYPEYCGVFTYSEQIYKKNYRRLRCAYDSGSMGMCLPEYFGNNCMIVISFYDYYCFDEANRKRFDHLTATQEYFGLESRCLVSTLKMKNQNLKAEYGHRCYKTTCNQAEGGTRYTITVQIGEETLTCTEDGQQLASPEGMTGTLNCPPSLEEFCDSYSPRCKNFCSMNGYCFNGACTCKDGWGGEACERCVGLVLEGRCLLKCPEGYYAKEQDCTRCSQDCLSCRNGSNCDQCESGYAHQETSSDESKCVKECWDGYYKLSLDKDVCERCSEGCSKCQNKETCLQCEYLTYSTPTGISCYEECPKGMLQVGQMCERCSQPDCVECDSGGCTRCKSGMWRFEGECSKSCPQGYYYGEEQKCLKCQEDCLQCSKESYCLECRKVGQEGKCLQACQEGYYQKGKECLSCSKGCKRCDAQNTCQECKGEYLLQDGKCSDDCPSGQYPSKSHKECLDCVEHCEECDSEHNCYRCNQNYYLMNKALCVQECGLGYYMEADGQCYPCAQSYCKDCAKSKCLECNDTHLILEGKCYLQCPYGFYQDGSYCWECQRHLGCLGCTSLDQCTECMVEYSLDQGQCFHLSSNNTIGTNSTTNSTNHTYSNITTPNNNSNYSNNTSNTYNNTQSGNYSSNATIPQNHTTSAFNVTASVLQCYPNCLTCFGPHKDNCLTCRPTYVLKTDTCKCPVGYREDSFTCQKIVCHPTCLECLNEKYNGCIECGPERELVEGECQCSNGLVDMGNGECVEGDQVAKAAAYANQGLTPVSDSVSQGAAQVIVSSAGSSLQFGQNLKMSDNNQKIGYAGYANLQLYGELEKQLKASQNSNQGALFQQLIYSKENQDGVHSNDSNNSSNNTINSTIDSNNSRLLQSQQASNTTIEDMQQFDSYNRFGKQGILLKDIVAILLSWLLGYVIFLIVIVAKQCYSKAKQPLIKAIKKEFAENVLIIYTLVFLPNYQEELLVLLFEITNANTSDTYHKISLSFAVLLLLHVLLSLLYITKQVFTNDPFILKITRLFGLISLTDKNKFAVSRHIAKTYILIKLLDKTLLTVMVILFRDNPSFLLYIFVATLLFAIITNFTFIYSSVLLLSLSVLTDAFTLYILFTLYQINVLANQINHPSQVRPLMTKVEQAQTLFLIYTFYKLGVFVVEILYAVYVHYSQKNMQAKQQLDFEYESKRQQELQQLFPSSQSLQSTQLSVQQQQQLQQTQQKQMPANPINSQQKRQSINQFNSNQSQESVMSYRPNRKQTAFRAANPFDSNQSYESQMVSEYLESQQV